LRQEIADLKLVIEKYGKDEREWFRDLLVNYKEEIKEIANA
jgi:hypothetical protein